MTIAQQLRSDLKKAILLQDEDSKANIRLVLGELDRVSKDPTDEDSMKVLKKLKKLETEVLSHGDNASSSLLEFIDSLLPTQIDEESIVQWIKDNVNFSLFRNKMQAVGLVMKHFGQGADGKMVKNIIQERF